MKAKYLVWALAVVIVLLGIVLPEHVSPEQSSASGLPRNQNTQSYVLSWQDAQPVNGTTTPDPTGDVLMIGGTTQGPSADGGEAMWTLTLQDGPVNQVQITLRTNGELFRGKGIHSLGQDGTVSLYLDDQLVHTIVCDTLGEFSNYWPASAPVGSPAYVTDTITLAEPVGPDLTFRIVAEPRTAIDINQVEIETAIVPLPPTLMEPTQTPSEPVSYELNWQDAQPVSGTNTPDPAGDVLLIGGTSRGPSADGGEAMWTLTLQDGPVNQVQITLWTNGERWGKGIHSLGQDGTVSLYLDDQLVHTIVCDTLGEFSNYWPASAPVGSPAYVTDTITLAEPVGPDLTFRIVAEPGTAIDINQVEIEAAVIPPPPTPAGLTGTPSEPVSYELSWQDAQPVSGTNTRDPAGDVLLIGGTTQGPSADGGEAMWTLTLQDGPVNQVQITLWTNGELYWGKGIHSLDQDGTVSLYLGEQLVHTIVCDTLGEFNNYWPASAPVGSSTYVTDTITLAEPVGPDLTFRIVAEPGTSMDISKIQLTLASSP
jgi:hypothetical protein